MVEVKYKLNLRQLFYPKCPYNDSLFVLALRLTLITLGTIGIYFFNIWISAVYLMYSLWFNVFIWPVKHCRYCYYKVRKKASDQNIEKSLLLKGEWKKSYLKKHVDCAKKWFYHSYILWLGPVVFVTVSFFLNFSMYALICLIGFLAVLAGTLLYVRFRICPVCAFIKECHEAF